MALVRYNEEVLMADQMGSELVTVYVGQEHQPFSVHKNLIAATGAQFNEMFNSNFIANQRITFEETGTAAFKLFIEYLYGKRIPKVSSHPSAAADSRGNRLRDLCQLYAFIEKYELENEILNRVMDAIQDGFVIMNILPSASLISAIYLNTQAGSKLRIFSVDTLIYALKVADPHYDDKTQEVIGLLKGREDILDGFVRSVQLILRGAVGIGKVAVDKDQDPRVRDCGGEAGCSECAHGVVVQKKGVWPCHYHVHTRGMVGADAVYDDTCHLWDAAVTEYADEKLSSGMGMEMVRM